MNSIQEFAIKKSIVKSKIHENNLSHLIIIKFLENNIDIKYIDLIHEYIKSAPITIRLKSKDVYNKCIFQSFLEEPIIKNRFDNKTNDELKLDSYFTYRFNKESKIFNKLYDESQPYDRVKYGSINIKNSIEGDELANSYGDISVFLNESIKERCTFTYGNSEATMWYVCTYKHFKHLLYHMPIDDIKLIIDLIDNNYVNRKMKTYIEIQMHGEINLSRDINKFTLSKSLYDLHKSHIETLQKLYPQIIFEIY